MWTLDPNALILIENLRLDWISHSSGLSFEGGEVVDSEGEQSGGIAKFGDVLPFANSRETDHKPIVADFSL